MVCCAIFVVLAAGFEPATSPFAGERSVLKLSYARLVAIVGDQVPKANLGCASAGDQSLAHHGRPVLRILTSGVMPCPATSCALRSLSSLQGSNLRPLA